MPRPLPRSASGLHRSLTAQVLVCLLLLTVTGAALADGLSSFARAGRGLAAFDPATGVIPFPNDILFAGSVDGTLNIPVSDPEDFSDPQVALNGLDGFSTIAPITTSFTNGLNIASAIGGQTVRVYEVNTDPLTKAVTGVVGELVAGVDYALGLSPVDANTLVITPLRPLKPKTSYLVALLKGLREPDGLGAGLVNTAPAYVIARLTIPLVTATGASRFPFVLSDDQAQQLEPLRQLVNAQQAVLASQGIAKGDIVLSWSFSTQSVGDILGTVKALVAAAEAPAAMLVDSGSDSPLGAADIFVGTLDVPYYLAAPSALDPIAPLSRFWQGIGGSNLTRFNTTPIATGTQTIPVLAAFPKTPKPATGWPTVIFQHGIMSNRTVMLGVADSLTSAGFAVVAIDLPLHGLTGNETGGTAAFFDPIHERTFNLDLVDNATGAPGQDGITDSSGTHFINLRQLLVIRDNLRQGVADLLALTRALSTLDVDGGGPDFDLGQLHFVGHSLGGIAGGVFLAQEPSVGAAVLAFTGGGLAKLLDGSLSFGPVISGGLAAAGIFKGTPDYEAFLGAAQTVLDSGDPINYPGASEGRGLLGQIVVGGNSSPPDLVIPNNVTTLAPPGTVPAPLAGTEPYYAILGLQAVDRTTTGEALKVQTRFNAGHHSSILTPNDAMGNPDPLSAMVTAEVQTEIAAFLASNGTQLPITDPSLIVPVSAP